MLHENDLEYPAAKALASVVITEKAFEPISEDIIRQAAAVMKQCREVICCTEYFGEMNLGNWELKERADALGLLQSFV